MLTARAKMELKKQIEEQYAAYKVVDVTVRANGHYTVFIHATPEQVKDFEGANIEPSSWNPDGSIAEYDVFIGYR